jgi:hypothetical protein
VDRVPSLDTTDADIPTPQCKGIVAIRHNRNTTATEDIHRHGLTIRLRHADIPRRDLILRRAILHPAAVTVPRRALIVAAVAAATAVHVVVAVIQVAAVPTVVASAVADRAAAPVAVAEATQARVAAVVDTAVITKI